jgi:signal transduction histidine kinase/ActR/RegA family two-component response regulator
MGAPPPALGFDGDARRGAAPFEAPGGSGEEAVPAGAHVAGGAAAPAEAGAAGRRLAHLEAATELFGAEPGPPPPLDRLARLLVPAFADLAFLDILPDGPTPGETVFAHVDAGKEAVLRKLRQSYPPSAELNEPRGLAIRTGRAVLITSVPEGFAESVARDPTHLELIRELAPRSIITAPLRVGERTLGCLSVAIARAGRAFDAADRDLVEALARIAALALDAARVGRRAAEAERSKEGFLDTVAHELRSPLTAILGWIPILRARRLDAATRERGLEVIERNARGQARLVGDLLDFSRAVAGTLRIERDHVPLGKVVEAAVAAIRPAAHARGLRLVAAIDAPGAQVIGDRARLEQVMTILLANAVKFTEPGGSVEVALLAGPNQAAVRVADTGAGIPPEELAVLFDPYRRRRNGRGLGLGLAIAKALVALHGGRIRAESGGPGAGATFTVELETAPPAGEPAPPADRERPALPAGGAGVGRGPVLAGVRVLVAEDDVDARELLTLVLERAGAAVTAVGSAAAALEAIGRARFDVLVGDIAMPGGDGYSLIRKVRALEPARGGAMKAVAVTALAGEQDQRQALRAGFDVHIPKPIEPACLVEVAAMLAGKGDAAPV